MYSGTNPETGKRRYRTATVVENRGDAERGLAELVSSVRSERSIGSASTVSGIVGGMVCRGEWVVGSYDDSSDPFSGRPVSSPAGWWDPVGDLTSSVIDATYFRLRVSGVGRG